MNGGIDVKIYTKIGDDGTTQLIGGKTVDKHSLRVDSYGTIDELNSIVGVIISKLTDKNAIFRDEFITVQHLLFDLGTDLAVPSGDSSCNIPKRLSEDAVKWLEDRIDIHSEELPVTMAFILPGGTEVAGLLHVARTVTRRVERKITALNQEEAIEPTIIKFANRLSDYFFVVARLDNKLQSVDDISYEKEQFNK